MRTKPVVASVSNTALKATAVSIVTGRFVLLRASRGELVEANVHEHFAHSRKGFERDHGFHHMLSGSFLAEFAFNGLVRIDDDYVQGLRERANQFCCPSFTIANIRAVPAKFTLRKSVDAIYLRFRLDPHANAEFRIERVEEALSLWPRHQTVRLLEKTTADGTRCSREINASKLLSAGVLPGENNATILNLLGNFRDVPPVILLSGLLGLHLRGSKPVPLSRLSCGRRSQIAVIGHYKFSDSDTASAAERLGFFGDKTCPIDGSVKPENIATGRRFGENPGERRTVGDRAMGIYQHLAHSGDWPVR